MHRLTETNGMKYCTLPDGSRQCTGARMGRHNTGTVADTCPTTPVTICQVPLYDGGYDKGGAYWGYTQGDNVYEIQGDSESENFSETRRAGSTLSLLWELASEHEHLTLFRCMNRDETETATNLSTIVAEMRGMDEDELTYSLEALDHAVLAFLWCHEHQREDRGDDDEDIEPEESQPTDMELAIKWQIDLWRLILRAEAFRAKAGGEQMEAKTLGHELGMMAAGTGCGMDQCGEEKGWPRAFRDAHPTTHHAFERGDVMDSGLFV